MSLKSNPIQTHSIFTTVLTHFWSILEPSSPPGGEWRTIYLKLQVQIFCFGTIRNASCHLLASFGFLVHIEVLLVVGLGLPLYAESAFPTDIFNSSCHSARPHDTESPVKMMQKRKSLWMSTRRMMVSRGFSQFDIFSNIHWTTQEKWQEWKAPAEDGFTTLFFRSTDTFNWTGQDILNGK